jgi:hypothetical protein
LFNLEAPRGTCGSRAGGSQFGVIWRFLEARVGLLLAGLSLMLFEFLEAPAGIGQSWAILVSCGSSSDNCGFRAVGGQFGVMWKLLEALVGLGQSGASLVSFEGSSRHLWVSGWRGSLV